MSQGQVTRDQPHNLEAERAVLGAPFVGGPRVFREWIATELKAGDFYLPAHREVFEVMASLDERDRPLDVITVGDELKARGALPRLEGGDAYLIRLADSIAAAENVPHYVRIVRERSNLRKVIGLCSDVQRMAYEATASVADLLEDLAWHVSRIATGDSTDLVSIGALASDLLTEFEERARRSQGPERTVDGVRFGVRELDDLILGLGPGDHCIVAADVGGGKTALAAQAGLTLVLVDGGVCIDFSLEMTRKQLAERAFVHLAKINSHLLRRGQVEYSQFRTLTQVASQLYNAAFYPEDKCFRTRDIVAKARRWRAKHPDKRGLVILDFIQLAKGDVRGENRARALGETAYEMKKMAKDLGVAVIDLSQFNREAVKTNKRDIDQTPPRPSKHDLRDSGEIEASADQIVLIYNPTKAEDGEVDLIVDKNRNGPMGTVKAHWIGRHYTFTDVTASTPIPSADPDGGWAGGRKDLD